MSTAVSSAQSTLDHIYLLHSKRMRLQAAQIEAEEAWLTQVSRECGDDLTLLVEAYRTYRAVAVPGFGDRWNSIMRVGHQTVGGRASHLDRNRPNHPDGRTWHGDWPVPERAPVPPAGISVVYVLYDTALVPCYVGSTFKFRDRMKAHARDGKSVHVWTAFPCANREEAYILEDRLLREHKPYLNRKARR